MISLPSNSSYVTDLIYIYFQYRKFVRYHSAGNVNIMTPVGYSCCDFLRMPSPSNSSAFRHRFNKEHIKPTHNTHSQHPYYKQSGCCRPGFIQSIAFICVTIIFAYVYIMHNVRTYVIFTLAHKFII